MRRLVLHARLREAGLVVGLIALVGIAIPGWCEAQRNQYRVKTAFREAVARPVRSTVRIWCNHRRAALGTIVDPDGYVLTKASELKGEIVCQLFDGRRMQAEIVGVREDYDLALLKIDAKDLPTIEWSQSGTPPVGSWLATTGLETIPISIGVVSAGPRKIERRIPALGIIIEDHEQGARIDRVMPGSGAAEAGLQPDDVVTHLDGERVASRDALIEAIRAHRPGDKVELKILRREKVIRASAVLGELRQITHGTQYFQDGLGGPLSERRAGFPLVFQHDTVLRPNQCGGPIVDLDGKAVGVNIARASRVASYAIPASTILPLLEELKAARMVSATRTD